MISLFFAIYRIFLTLGAIEKVTITSQEAIEELPEAVKKALLAVELEKKPYLALDFYDVGPPFHVNAGKNITIKFNLSLKKGDIARNINVFFNAPPGFIFPKATAAFPPPILPNYVSAIIETRDIIYATIRYLEIDITAPQKQDTYPIYYQIACEGFTSYLEEFKVMVE